MQNVGILENQHGAGLSSVNTATIATHRLSICQLFTIYCSEDDFTVHGRDVGRVKGVEIYRDTNGWGDGWHLDSVSYLVTFIKWRKFPYIHFLTVNVIDLFRNDA